MKKSLEYAIYSLLIGIVWLTPYSCQAAHHATKTGRIASLLQQARQAITRNHLTVPAEHSAVKYAEQILAIEPTHPEAFGILQQVIKRYNTLGLSAVARVKSLQQQEVQKAHDYQQRAQAIAERHQLGTTATRPLDEQLASVRTSTPTLRDAQKSLQAQLAEVAAGYVSLAETALAQGYVQEARRYQTAAEVLSNNPYKLPPNRQLIALTERLDRLETGRRSNRLNAKNTVAITSGRTDIFLPPAF